MIRRLAEFLRGRKQQQFQLKNPYRMLPSDDGGETYRMECILCRQEGNVMGAFQHALNCPAARLERNSERRG